MGFVVAIGVAIGVFVIAMFVLPKAGVSETEERRQATLSRMYEEHSAAGGDDKNILRDSGQVSHPLARMALQLPGGLSTYELMLKAGYMHAVPKFLGAAALFFAVALLVLTKMGFGLIGLALALAATWFFPRKFLQWKIAKRNELFLDQFPNAVDMIVRSVKSGHPLNTSFKMIVDNLEPPVSEEFKQVVDEISYGRSMPEALARMAGRVDESDLQFFVVVLSVQQETGGNLAEVLSNLSNIIRKRKQLRMKIKAMTSEGRATAWVLGLLPVLQFGAIYYTTPGYLNPLLYTPSGNILLGIAISMLGLAVWIVKNMVNIEI